MVLFSVKLLLALQSASLAVIYPFINLHMFSLGFTRAQITQTNIIICASDIIVPLLTGVLADKVENFRYCRILDLRTALRSRETTIYNIQPLCGRLEVGVLLELIITWQVPHTNTDNLQWSSQRVFISSSWSQLYLPISDPQNSL